MYNMVMVILFKVFFSLYRNISLDAELSVFSNIKIKYRLDCKGTYTYRHRV